MTEATKHRAVEGEVVGFGCIRAFALVVDRPGERVILVRVGDCARRDLRGEGRLTGASTTAFGDVGVGAVGVLVEDTPLSPVCPRSWALNTQCAGPEALVNIRSAFALFTLGNHRDCRMPCSLPFLHLAG